VKLTIEEFTSDGKLELKFNQLLEVPELVKKATDARRRLMSLDQIDMTKIIMLTVVQKSDSAIDNL
jgi:hypothetical protein